MFSSRKDVITVEFVTIGEICTFPVIYTISWALHSAYIMLFYSCKDQSQRKLFIYFGLCIDRQPISMKFSTLSSIPSLSAATVPAASTPLQLSSKLVGLKAQ